MPVGLTQGGRISRQRGEFLKSRMPRFFCGLMMMLLLFLGLVRNDEGGCEGALFFDEVMMV